MRAFACTALHCAALVSAISFKASEQVKSSSYSNPTTLSPDLMIDSDLKCSMTLWTNVELSKYTQVEKVDYVPSCNPPWTQVILRVRGAISGVQFDRWGALWVGGVELLRTTTPEPYGDGIIWKIDKDVTFYANALTRASNATLTIPNLVNSLYTGILSLNVSLDFYGDEWSQANERTHVAPLVDFSVASNPTSEMCLKGSESVSAMVTLPKQNIWRMWLDIFASPHKCEEFWYSNLPSSLDSSCGGGAFRQIQAYVDGNLAGAVLPFPVVYTGGFNPLLWRPLTGIESFDVESYRMDISAYLGVLNDGKEHNISVSVVNNGDTGSWCLDPSLVMEEHPSASSVTGTAPQLVGSTAPDVTTKINTESTQVETASAHRFSIIGTLHADNREEITHKVTMSLHSWSSNIISGTVEQETSGKMVSHVDTSLESNGQLLFHSFGKSTYPYSMHDYLFEDDTDIMLNSSVSYSRDEEISLSAAGKVGLTATWTNGIDAGAVYARSLDHTNTTTYMSSNVEKYQASTNSSGTCMDRVTVEGNGAIFLNGGVDYQCDFNGLKLCGMKLCGLERYISGTHSPRTPPPPFKASGKAQPRPVVKRAHIFEHFEPVKPPELPDLMQTTRRPIRTFVLEGTAALPIKPHDALKGTSGGA